MRPWPWIRRQANSFGDICNSERMSLLRCRSALPFCGVVPPYPFTVLSRYTIAFVNAADRSDLVKRRGKSDRCATILLVATDLVL